jgi:hypothetical protein
MGHRVEGNTVVITFDPDSQTLSKSGKTRVLATSSGFKKEQLADGSEIMVSYNICKKV